MADPSRGIPRFNVFAQEFVPGQGFAAPPPQQPQMYAPRPMMPMHGQPVYLPQNYIPQQMPMPAFPQQQPMPNYMRQPVVCPPVPIMAQHPQMVAPTVPQQQSPPPPQQQPAPAAATPPPPVVATPPPPPVVATPPPPVVATPPPPVVATPPPQPQPVVATPPPQPTPAVEEATNQVDNLRLSSENGDSSSKPIAASSEIGPIAKKEEEWERSPSPSGETDANNAASADTGEGVVPKPKPIAESRAPKKDHVNLIFCGHVDAGKSTIGGHIMYLCGLVDKRTLEKYEKEAKEMNRESWFYAWALDTNAEERDKGITVEVGRAHFETESKRYTILDAPGHKSFVPNMISGAAQADVAILVISARKGEFETGFERGGQTREHAMLVKTAGVKHLIVLINKMDESTVGWEEARYLEIKKKLTPFLNNCGFRVKPDGGGDVFFMPCSGFSGDFLKHLPPESVCSWFKGPTLLEYLDKLPGVGRQIDGPVRLPIVEKYRDMGTVIMGKLETGTLTIGTKLVVMPNKVPIEVIQVMTEEDEVQNEIRAGENTKLKLKGIEEEDISTGFILCSPNSLCHTARIFDAQVAILDYKSIICPGWGAVMHVHTCTQEVQLRIIICLIDKKTGEKGEIKPKFMKQDQVAIARFEVLNQQVVCLETFKDFPQLGRFTLRDEGKTVAIGKVLKIVQ